MGPLRVLWDMVLSYWRNTPARQELGTTWANRETLAKWGHGAVFARRKWLGPGCILGTHQKGERRTTKAPRETPGQDRDHYDQDNTPLTNERTNQTPPTRRTNNEDNQPKSGQDRK